MVKLFILDHCSENLFPVYLDMIKCNNKLIKIYHTVKESPIKSQNTRICSSYYNYIILLDCLNLASVSLFEIPT